MKCGKQRVLLFIEGKESLVQCACCKSWAGKRETSASLVHENHKFLYKVNICPSWIKHGKPIQYLLIISSF